MNEPKKPFLSTKDVAELLEVNEKMIYSLVSEKGLPATKVTGKWLFPRRLVEQWLEGHIINYPRSPQLPSAESMFILAGSHDILFEKVVGLFNRLYPDHLAVFGNVGSMRGLEALSSGLCHAATSHLLQEDEEEYNFEFVNRHFGGGELPAVVNFSRREQGLLIQRGNPKDIHTVADLAKGGIKIANRPEGTGTRLLLDKELEKAGIEGSNIEGYDQEFRGHLDVGMELLSGRHDVAPGIRAVADLLDLEFISLRWERYDLLISKGCFFERGVQLFLGLLHEAPFRKLAEGLKGYDLSLCGKAVFPRP